MNNEYLSEENYQRTNNKVKKVGKILLISGAITLVLGVIIAVIGFVGIGTTVTNGMDSVDASGIASGMFTGFGCIAFGAFFGCSLGFSLLIAGAVTTVIGHRREISAYSTQQVMPIAQEGIDKMAPTVGKAAGTIAKEIKDGLSVENND